MVWTMPGSLCASCRTAQSADPERLLRPNRLFIHSSEGPAKRILQFVEPPLIAIILDVELFEAGRFSVNLVGQDLVRRELLSSRRFLILHVQGFENLAH